MALSPIGADEAPVWVFFKDKPQSGPSLGWPAPQHLQADSALDAPVNSAYIDAVAGTGARIRTVSRWFNAVSADVSSPKQLSRLRRLEGVREVRAVGAWRRSSPVPPRPVPAPRSAQAPGDYGEAYAQIASMEVHTLHSRGVRGEGVRIGFLDSGYNWRDHVAFTNIRVLAERDFINGDEDVSDEIDEPVTGFEQSSEQNLHGTRMLAISAGYDPGHFIGVAPEAEYVLAKTEEIAREPRIEEDRWIAGVEWLDSLGVQVVNSSLGYTEFDDSSTYRYEDLDGATALTTIAAELMVERGIVVVASAGNEALLPWHYVTPPADGIGVITVGAVHPVALSLGVFSSRGPTADGRIKPDVVAPGVSVFSVSGRAASEGARNIFTLRDYQRGENGTSFASAFVAGAAALLLQVHPDWSPRQVAEALRATAQDLGPAGPDTAYGWGMVNMAQAIGFIAPTVSMAGHPFPNPVLARHGSVIHFPLELAEAELVEITIFDIGGVRVGGLEAKPLWPGRYLGGSAPMWAIPGDLAAGVYYYQISADSFRRLGKLAVLRAR
ncbi:MAG: S8 family serine peptidase [Candidatus Latescibacterota bacterium]|nr:S8 family serine peptidase [Candidatus Latescibacterota bacterium]